MKTTDDMTDALARYAGAVTVCRSGRARADRVPLPQPTGDDSSAAGWQRPPPDLKAKRRARRMARAERNRIREHNRAVRRRKGGDEHR
jgi:hypothetical protein